MLDEYAPAIAKIERMKNGVGGKGREGGKVVLGVFILLYFIGAGDSVLYFMILILLIIIIIVTVTSI